MDAIYTPGSLQPFLPIFQINQISDVEIWIYRVGLSVCFILLILLIMGKRQKNSRKKQNKRSIGSEGDFRLELEDLKTKVTVLDQKLTRISTISYTDKNNKVKKSNSESQKEAENITKLKEFEEEIPSPEIDLPVDSGKKEEEDGKKPEVYYLSSPDKEKAFYAPEASLTPQERTMYIVEGDQLRLFDQIDEQTMRLALNSLDILVKRVCDVSNAKEPQHTKIVMIEPGEIVREQDDLQVTTKMKVKFE